MNDKHIKGFLNSLEQTNVELSDFIDIEKVESIINKIEIQLNALNYILCFDQNTLNERIKELFKENKNVFKVLPYLIAISKNKLKNDSKIIIKQKNNIISLEKMLNTPEGIINFFNETRLNKLIINGKIKNFVDYLTGVEVGLDSNARKNRFGQKNEKEIEKIIYEEFSKYSFIKINKQLIISDFSNNSLLKNKKFDFVISNELNNKKVLIETTFYNTGGSKINETSKSFNKIYNEIKKYYNDGFLWVADGKGIESVKKYLINNFEDFDFIKNKTNFIQEIKKKLEIEK